ncbi:MAG: 3-hydroxyacyl-ACP dehydratase FabZ family protein [Solirubrobacteraceae bacterium]
MLDMPDIRRLLPHGHPMLLVDRVVALERGRAITGTKAITFSEPCYRQLSMNLPLEQYAYPVSLLLESFGQTAALLWLHAVGQNVSNDRVLMLVTVQDCRIDGRALPGDVLRHVVRLVQVAAGVAVFEGETYVESSRIVSVGSLIAVMRSRGDVDRTGARAAKVV